MAVYQGTTNTNGFIPNGYYNDITVNGDASTYYPCIIDRGWGNRIVIQKHVHNYALWDGWLNFYAEWNSYGWGGWSNQWIVRQHISSSRTFMNWGTTSGPSTYIVLYLLGGGRTYTYYTDAASGGTYAFGGPYYTTTDLGNNGTIAPTSTGAGAIDWR
jgi:hypothetical protein